MVLGDRSLSLICSRELGQVNLQEVSTSCWIWFPALFFLFHFLCSSSSFSLLFSCFLILHCMPMRKWNMSDYCVPETKACQEQVFLLVNALQCHTQDVQPQTSSLPWVPTLHGISSVHQHALAHRKEKTKQALKSRFMAPKPLNYRQVNRSGKPHGAGGASHWDHVSQLGLIHPDGHHNLLPASLVILSGITAAHLSYPASHLSQQLRKNQPPKPTACLTLSTL